MRAAFLLALPLLAQDPGAHVPVGTESAIAVCLGEGSGALITTADGAGTYDISEGRVVKEFRGAKRHSLFAISGDGRVGIGSGAIWNLETGEVLRTVADGKARLAAISRDGRVAATAGLDGVATWDAGTGLKLAAIAKLVPASMAISPDGALLATGEAGLVRVWDVKSGGEKASFDAREPGDKSPESIVAVRFAPDGRRVASSWSRRAQVVVWELGGGQQVIKAPLAGPVKYIAFSGDGRRLAISDGARVIVLEAGGTVLATHVAPTAGLALPGAGTHVAVASGGLVMLPLSGVGVPDRILLRPGAEPPKSPLLSADGAFVAAQKSVWETKTGRLVLAAAHEIVAFAPDGKRAYGLLTGNLVVYDIATGKEQSRIKVKSNGLTQVVWLTEGRRFVALTSDDNLLVVEAGGKTVREIRLKGATGGFTLSADGLRAAIVMKDEESVARAHLVDLEKGGLKALGPEAVVSAAISPDAHVVATVNTKGEFALIDVESGLTVRSVAGKPGGVKFSPDGKTLAIERAGTLVVEETLSGRVVARLHGVAGWFGYLDDATLISLPELAVWKIR